MKIKFLVIIYTLSFLVACASTPPTVGSRVMEVDATNTSTDATYGYSESNPILLGGFMLGTEFEGIHHAYFQNLIGPQWQKVQVERLGSCCAFSDPSLAFGGGLLDQYQLSYKGQKEPVVVYVNLYKYDTPKAPLGFGLL